MKRALVAMLLLAAAATGASAQDVKIDRQPATGRVAVVNIGLIFNKYYKARQFKRALEDTLLPYKEKGKKLDDEIKQWEAEVKNGAANVRELKAAIKKNKRLFEDLSEEVTSTLGKMQENNLVTLWKDVQTAIRTCADQNSIDAVYGYGDPMEKEPLEQFPNVNRKMQAMDLGSSVPLAVTPNADISQVVIDVLNKNKSEKTPQLGTDRVAIVNIGQVFNQYKNAMKAKANQEQDLLPYKRKGKKLTDDIAAWEQAIKLGKTEDDNGVRFDAKIAQAKKRLEEMSAEISGKPEKKREQNLVQLWKEVQAGTKNYASVHHIDLVLGYGDPMEKQLLDQFPNVNRKMQAMDLGSILPLFFSPKRDVSSGVVSLLNTAIEPNTTLIHLTKVAYFFDLSVSFDKPNKSPVAVEKVKDLLAPARIRTVNIGVVFNKYAKAQQFKKELEITLAPYKQKGKKLTDEIKEWETDIKNGAANEQKLKSAIKKHKRELEDMSAEITNEVGKKQEDNLVTLWKEVQAGIRTYAAENNVDVVVGYGDPMYKEILDQFPNVNRKMQAMDLGSTAPLFVRPHVEIGDAVAELLNKQHRAVQKKNAATK